MGGKRIAEQVRRALIAAAKVAAIAGVVDVEGCGESYGCAYQCQPHDPACPWLSKPDAIGSGGHTGDAGPDAHDASKDRG